MTLKFESNGEFLVNTETSDRQIQSATVALKNGKYAYVWKNQEVSAVNGGDGDSESVKIKIFNADGTVAVDEFLVNSTFTLNSQSNPQIAMLENGKVVVTWQTNETPVISGGDGSSLAIKAKIINPNGSTFLDEFVANSLTSSTQENPQVTALEGGRFVVTYDTYANGGQLDVAARIFEADGTPVAGKFAVQTIAGGAQAISDVIALANGNFVVAFESDGSPTDASQQGISYRVFDKDGNALMLNELTANTSTIGNQTEPQVTALTHNGVKGARFLITWESDSAPGDIDGTGISGRIFSADGTPVTGEFLVNQTTVDDQVLVGATELDNGWFVVTWEDDEHATDSGVSAIVARVFDETGTPVGDQFVVNDETSSAQIDPSIATLSDGRVVISWTTHNATPPGGDGDGFAIKSKVIKIYNKETGDGADNVLNGVAIIDIMKGKGGNELYGARRATTI